MMYGLDSSGDMINFLVESGWRTAKPMAYFKVDE